MPLELVGRRVVVTRAEADTSSLCARLSARGADVIVVPTIQIQTLDPLPALEAALRTQSGYAMLLLGSSHAVDVVRVHLERLALSLTLSIGCVGRQTQAYAQHVWASLGDIVAPEVARAEGLFALLAERFKARGGLQSQRFLFPRAQEGRLTLIELLEAAGAWVEAIPAYRIVAAPPASAELRAALKTADTFTFLSGETLRCFLQVVPEEEGRALLAAARVAVIGPVASTHAQALGIRVDVVPAQASIEALVDAL